MTTEYKPQITLGNLIQIGIMLATGAMAFATVNGRAATNAENISKNVASISSLESRTRTLENSLARSDERTANILQLLNRIDARLERIERKDAP